MKLEERVCSFELARKLRKLNVPLEELNQLQDSYWWWHYNRTSRKWYLDKNLGGRFPNPRSSIAAPTVAELMKALPGRIEISGKPPYYLRIAKIDDIYETVYCCAEIKEDDLCCFIDNKLVDALAKTRIYLISITMEP